MKNGKTVGEDRFPPNNGFGLAGRERDLIARVLEQCHWNQSRTAPELGITRNTLRYRMEKYGIRKD
ncbi:MAG: helix-turn-helix domain-containing protein, partial [Desulfatiglandaceae bacterium]